jgi:hypothetical protein
MFWWKFLAKLSRAAYTNSTPEKSYNFYQNKFDKNLLAVKIMWQETIKTTTQISSKINLQ